MDEKALLQLDGKGFFQLKSKLLNHWTCINLKFGKKARIYQF